MLAKHFCVFVVFVILDILQNEIRALQNQFKFFPGASLNKKINSTIVSSEKVCCYLCMRAGPECKLVSYSEEEHICELSATKLARFSSDLVDVDPWFKLYSSGSAYTWVKKKMTWSDAKLYCEENGWHLAHIQSSEEQEDFKHALAVHFGTTEVFKFWIGASKQKGQFLWTDNTSAVAEFGWNTGQPDNQDGPEDCLVARSLDNYSWHDYRCDAAYWFICEYQ